MVSTTELSEALRPSVRREQHMLVVAAAIALSISVAAVRNSDDVSKIVTWFVGCFVLGAIATAWYRWRTRTCRALITAIENGSVPSKLSIARFTINYIIPFGHVVAFDAGTLRDINVGFWTRRRAEHFALALADGAPSTATLPGARVV